MVRKMFTDLSSSLLDTMINKTPTIAFLDLKKVCNLVSFFFLFATLSFFPLFFFGTSDLGQFLGQSVKQLPNIVLKFMIC